MPYSFEQVYTHLHAAMVVVGGGGGGGVQTKSNFYISIIIYYVNFYTTFSYMGHWTAQLHYWLTCIFPFPNSNKCHTNSFEQVYTRLPAAAWGFWKWGICCKRQEPRHVTSDLPSFLTVKILLHTVTVLVLLVILLLIQWNAWWQTIHMTNHNPFQDSIFVNYTLTIPLYIYIW